MSVTVYFDGEKRQSPCTAVIRRQGFKDTVQYFTDRFTMLLMLDLIDVNIKNITYGGKAYKAA